MNSISNLVMAFIVAMGLFLQLGAASAQEPSAEHLAAARKAIAATSATVAFDNILPQAAFTLKNEMTANNPNKADEITTIVDEETLAIAARRGDLEKEAARIFANTFTESELVEISNFFNSELGQKYLASTPILVRELQKAARIWATGIQRDLVTNVQKRIGASNN